MLKILTLAVFLLIGWGAWKYLAPPAKEEAIIRNSAVDSAANLSLKSSERSASPAAATQIEPAPLLPADQRAQTDIPAVRTERGKFLPPSPERRATLMNADMDESESKVSPYDPAYDRDFLSEALQDRKAGDPWREKGFLPIAGGYYDVVLESLKQPEKKTLFYADLEKYQFRGADWLYPASIFYQDPGQAWQTINIEKWRSPYLNEEIYFGALHFPYDAFWKRFLSAECKEVLVLYVTLLSPASSKGITSRFTARAYCRMGFRELTPFALMNFSRNNLNSK